MNSPQRDQWFAALKAEYDALIRNHTWKLVNRPKTSRGKPVKVITSGWVLRIKRDEHGNVLRYKARLVIHGYQQKYGLQYHKTYSPVARLITE
ncbi:Retrotransposon protein, Ty1-Copia subclass [Phytophthora megakarya]|uniref:Retrotransposon protein, Ty1-Copia subclass n=1 Tax=Phytophthora megakarya TaxID=4795 RepID=A0A225UF87_9STRA|nr:Retrotransposon protein, Ty1-Copia subclass [Phytophthora megakarya]